jgi:NADPH-dependent ferric siderophore reductase
MLRLTLAGAELTGFTSLSPDDHVKVVVPAEAGSTERRDYTPRRFDAQTHELAIDFALHDGGPVTTWARHARPGDPAEIGGPRGSMRVPHDFDWWLLIGDETALPAIGRRIEELPERTPVTSIKGSMSCRRC